MPTADRRLWLTRLTGVAALLLIGVTWPLWLPPTPTSFPQLPLFGWLIPAPAWCDWIALAGALLGAVGMAVLCEPEAQARPDAAPPRLRFGLTRALAFAPALFTISLAFALALNQIRVQVWAYQFLLLGSVLSLCPRTETGDRAAVALGRVLAMGILFHSGLSKLDLAFAEGPGRWLMGGFLGLFGVEADGLDEKAVAAIAFAVPAWEIALSLLLALPGTRRVGLIAAVFMHTSVVATLWKLDQSWGVLLWNAFFLAHEFLLFWPAPRAEGVPLWTTLRTAGPRAAPAALLILAAVLLPFGTRSGSWDVWPGWAVYAGGVPRAVIMRGTNGDDWERAGRSFAARPDHHPGDSFSLAPITTLDMERSGLAELFAPIPQDPRTRVGVARTLEARSRAESRRSLGESSDVMDMVMAAPDDEIQLYSVTRTTPNGRWDEPIAERWGLGQRRGIDNLLDSFLLNARPRALSLPAEAR
ncbi:hypothetical protein [Alienimonas californiensis]|uniref:hypothetical protein n=1 Tax=Alienimonas californiensis TaxID=2527989 RepID=UPI0011A4781C|nr:hypothetical protein [Alienimonas californiensis]